MNWEEFVAANVPAPVTITVQQHAGSGAYGAVYETAVQVAPCVVDDTRRTVTVQTVDAQGDQVISSSTVFAPLTPVIEPGSLVTVPWRSRPAKVLAVERLVAHGLDLPEHQELALE
jgi:hypothetical protein